MTREEKRHLATLVHALRNAMAGNSAPYGQALRDRMMRPRPGDVVYETSTLYALLRNDPDLTDDRWDGQFTPYLRTDREWIRYPDNPGDGPWTDDGYWETYLVCQNPDGTEYRWTNAELCAIPFDLAFVDDVQATASRIVDQQLADRR